jgi:peptidoglycan/LPS O-acetylase OafA/YrhL
MTFLAKSRSSDLRWAYGSIKRRLHWSQFFFIFGILACYYRDAILDQKILKSDFYSARLARIYPLHLLTLLIVVPLTLQNVNFQIDRTLAQTVILILSLTQSFVPIKNIFFFFLILLLSISNELFFLFAISFYNFLISRIKKVVHSKLYKHFYFYAMLVTPPTYYKVFSM